MRRKDINQNLIGILNSIPGGSFLEIGLGPRFREKRMAAIHQNSIEYTGLDFQNVCEMHADAAHQAGFPSGRFRFLGNTCGTYLFNLVRLKREGKKYDLIYLDGHHTLYVDFPAAMACIPLLKPGGLFAFDDVNWTLGSKAGSLGENEFYKDIYDFSLYTEEEKNEPHIRIIVEEYFIEVFSFSEVEDYSSSSWRLLKAPQR